MKRRVLLCAAALCGCSGTGDKQGGASFLSGLLPASTPAPPPAIDRPMIERLKPGPYTKAATAIGVEKDLARQRGEGLGFVSARPLEETMAGIIAKLAKGSGVTDIPGRPVLLANPQYAAYSTADGNLYVSMGWLPYLENEDELAAALAHELAHVLLMHHGADLVMNTQKRLQALHEAAVNLKTQRQAEKQAAGKTGAAQPAAPSRSDQRDLKNVKLATDLGDKLLMPAFNRNQEREADLLGIDLLVSAGYSPLGMTTLLEKLREYEKKNRQSEEEFTQQLTETAAQDTWRALKLLGRKLTDSISVAHPDTGERIEAAAAYIDKFHADAAGRAPASESWQRLKQQPAAQEVLHNYQLAFEARRQLDAPDVRPALVTARSAASGATATHAYPNWVVAKAATRLGQHNEAAAALERAVSADEPVAEVYSELIAVNEQRNRNDIALKWAEQASARFGDSVRWMPDRIRLLRKLGRVSDANTLTARCTVEAPDWRRLCQEANTPPTATAGAKPAR
jgi:predicted Zn-dependent protease